MREDTLAALLAATQAELVRSLQSIEIAVWSLVGLIAVALAIWYSRSRKRRIEKADQQPSWQDQVEEDYDKGNYENALQTLATLEFMYPQSVLIRFWQGRCYFRQENWQSAVSKFEECLRLEPYYRRSVRDYMAFIELNGLVPGVEGYREKRDAE